MSVSRRPTMSKQSALVTGRTRLFAVALVVAVCGAFGAHLVAQSRPRGATPLASDNKNFDIRRDDPGGEYMSRLTSPAANPAAGALAADRIAGVALLKGPNDAVDVEVSPELGTPEVVTSRRGAGFLSAPTSDRTATLRAFLASHRARTGCRSRRSQVWSSSPTTSTRPATWRGSSSSNASTACPCSRG